MDDRGANIDLLFRNGLKDYEVLPPVEAWDNIQPSIRNRSGTIILFRAAAVIVVLIATSVIASRWGREISTYPANSLTAFDIEKATPAFSHSYTSPSFSLINAKLPVDHPVSPQSGNISENAVSQDQEAGISQPPGGIDAKDINFYSSLSSFARSFPVNLLAAQKKAFKILPIDLQLFPENTPRHQTERWSIGAMASPTYYSRFGSGNALAKQLMASEQPLISYSGGLAVSYKLNKRFSVQTGLYYSSLGQEVDGINSFAGFQKYNTAKGDHSFEIQTSSGTIFTKNSDIFIIADGSSTRVTTVFNSDIFDPKKASLQYMTNTVTQNFSYLDLPVVLRYKLIDKTLGVNLIGGLSYSMLVNNSVFAKVDGSKIAVGTTEGLNLFTLSSSFGMGMEYTISHKMSLNFEPTFRYYINPFNDISGSRDHPFSFGVFSGLSYKF